ncbi:hypothetical protein FG167_16060 [Lacinutrix sp. WUR7]|uniref:hypothetical protein n=1 Tax=Lacinutrix sp. WUR7 TaxID=2653681 RepID=UPI00193CF389|nr:hypothetical protein [Lacinutrix sp. WUR7]QRM90686.1 hypothetical protein FG167_16060 [Lacinutrix sp. WUR7]
MRIKDTDLKHYIESTHISEYGKYYFFEDFIISEIHEGVIYNWEASQDIIEAAEQYYGKNLPICYISNRVNKYSVNPIDWFKFFKSERNLNGYAIVSYSENGWINAMIEKFFFASKMERFKNIEHAILWAKNVNLDLKNKNHLNNNLISF